MKTKLSEIQQTLNAPKNQFNKFGNYAYRSCEDILGAVKPLLGTATLTIKDDIVQIGGRVYIKATVTFKDEDVVEEVSAFAREPENKKGMDESQITGAASSYARKYALNGLFLIDDTKDADATSTGGKNPGQNKKQQKQISYSEKLTQDLRNSISFLTDKFKNKDKIKQICGDLGIKELSELSSRSDETKKEMNDFLKRLIKSLKAG